MRKTKNIQLQFGETPISEIRINLKSRDDIPPLLLGLQYIYITPAIREAVFKILEDRIAPESDHNNGRPGMDLWKILVLGVLRVNLNWDYDRLEEMANQHNLIRQMLGHGIVDEKYEYKLQTLKDNVHLLTPEILEELNVIVVQSGHNLVNKKEENEEIELNGRCDSFVVETDVHYPTDINLLFDAMRKVISLIAALSLICGLCGWRQFKQNIKKVKKSFRKAQQLKRSTSKNSEKQDQRDQMIIEAHQTFIDIALVFLERAEKTLGEVCRAEAEILLRVLEIENYIAHAKRQIDQIRRRAILGETIPHDEKVFSIFEPHTEWISKGKAGVPVELGLKVCVLEDQYGFILHHRVMQDETDDQVAVLMIEQTKEHFPYLTSCSFDKGFHSPENQKELPKHLDRVILPKKGKLSQKDQEREYSNDFIKARHQHSAVESAINALGVHGLDRCLDYGIIGFKRYVSLAVLGRNIQKIGVKLQQDALAEEQRSKKKNQAA